MLTECQGAAPRRVRPTKGGGGLKTMGVHLDRCELLFVLSFCISFLHVNHEYFTTNLCLRSNQTKLAYSLGSVPSQMLTCEKVISIYIQYTCVRLS